ncbi:MAG TPA: extracellular solute-binding protein, partial [Hyphomicrobiaceae bacterium]|nr:extracellular solute-binding protein [Hyphomicrobiaceae bacterium]
MVSATTQKYLRVSSQTWSGKNWSNQTWPGQTWVMRILAVLACIMYPAWPNALAGGPVHGIAMHGAPQLAPDFPHLPYASATAPKGGRITLGVFGTFDSLNPLIIRGVAPPDIRGLVYESLMARNGDEPFSLYGLIAETVEVPDDRSAITFHINPLARFSDGKPVLADDVAFSFHLLAKKGRPYMRSHYSKVASADVLGRHSIRFTFKASAPAHGGPAAPDREMPLIMGLMPVLPRHAIDPETFDRPGTAIPTGSGPYLVRNVTGGASLSFIRNKDYWARDLPIRRGIYNFDEIRMRYYRDGTAQFQAFKAGIVDLRWETDPSRWIAGYDIPIINKGRAKKYAFPTNLPAGMTGLVLNTRRPQFADPRV